jgi:DNA-binding GntR family transcriptional regulator
VFPEREDHSLNEHDELLDALASNDATRARTIAEEHVLDAVRSLAMWLEQTA